ncbi:MAG: ABC transporter ATP-binding protein [Lachnospiraceae bacterium]|nr:ABC transporter ATP-binding protein [Lachnospiraceae bacterium]MBP3352880.1 ABC transporter ATP-binding protein [Lachnospiraceae bacterium]
MGNILRLENIYKTFDSTPVLKGIHLDVEEGEFITLLGSSGCGKTTTLRIIAGLEQADKGRVWLNGEDITDLAPNKRNVNTVFQNYALFPHMSVAENIGYGLKIRKAPKAEITEKVEKMLRLVQLEGFGERMPDQLSGGQRQRVAIARAVINEPGVLLLDEPLGALDLKLRRQMQQELKRIQKQLGITFIYITHDQEEAINMSDRIAVMREGRFEQIGTPNEIYYHPQTSYVASFVGDANIYREAGKTYAIRAENVLMDGEEACVMEAVIREKSFAGGQLRIVFELKDGQRITANRYGIDVDRKVGETIKVGWNKEQAVLVQDVEETEHGERKEA